MIEELVKCKVCCTGKIYGEMYYRMEQATKVCTKLGIEERTIPEHSLSVRFNKFSYKVSCGYFFLIFQKQGHSRVKFC